MTHVWAAVAWAVIGPMILLATAPLLDGIARQIRARLESRAGPPLLQGYVDLAKLAGKAEVSAGTNPFSRWLPALALAAAVLAGLLLPIGGRAPLGFAGDGLVVVYLLTLSSTALALAGGVSGSTFATLGLSREMLLLFLAEPVIAAALFVLGMKSGSFRLADAAAWQAAHGPGISGVLAAAGVLLALPATMGRLPFDQPEAEQELMGGLTVEYGGRRLALFRWTLFVRWLVTAWLVAEVFLPTPFPLALAIPAAAVKGLFVFGIAMTASALLARLRLDRVRAYFAEVALLMGSAFAFAWIGA